MRLPAIAALGAVAYGVFLVATMPAAFVLARAQDAQPDKFEVREAHGTAWHGRAKVALNTPGGIVPIDRVEWRLLPARLALGRIAFDIGASAAGIEARYEGARSLTRWTVRNLDVRGAAPAMAHLLPWLVPLRPEGTVAITSAELSSDGRELQGDARVEWKGAAVGLSDVKPLGTYRAEIRAEGHAGKVTVSTLEGRLRVTGHGTLTPPTRFAFTGEARAEAAAAQALEPLLNLLGPARPDGARALSWQAR
ncbi:MAG: type II secretion system protein N [Pseudomonadota bacterium]|nr:type II secretion system protein N [Pseudomonadota bacterium]